jgi:hypothetical protein
MKAFLTPIILCLFIISGFTVKSQNLGIDTASMNLASLPDTINLNDNYNHTIGIRNYNSTPLTGTIYLVAGVDTSGTGILNSIDTVGSVAVINFGLNDTVGISYNENYNLINGYRLGGNIVVVWPVAGSGSVVDSLFKNVYILNPLTTNESSWLKDQIIVYPNPANNFLFLKNNTSINTVKRVRILDINGKVIFTENFSSRINISQLTKGVYFLTLLLKNEEELHYKLIKE